MKELHWLTRIHWGTWRFVSGGKVPCLKGIHVKITPRIGDQKKRKQKMFHGCLPSRSFMMLSCFISVITMEGKLESVINCSLTWSWQQAAGWCGVDIQGHEEPKSCAWTQIPGGCEMPQGILAVTWMLVQEGCSSPWCPSLCRLSWTPNGVSTIIKCSWWGDRIMLHKMQEVQLKRVESNQEGCLDSKCIISIMCLFCLGPGQIKKITEGKTQERDLPGRCQSEVFSGFCPGFQLK